MLSGSQHNKTDKESNVLLGSAAGIAALLLVFLLYLNKRRWWTAVNGVGCCDDSCPSPVRRSSTPTSIQTAVPNTTCVTNTKNKTGKSYVDGSDSSSETESMASTAKVNMNTPQMPTMSGFYVPVQRSHRDLMSLVEKGKVAISSNSSCCSSTTSSIGERHAAAVSTNNPEHVDVTHSIITHEIRETKIDNHDDDTITFQKDEIEKCTSETTDVNSNRDCIVIMNTESFDAQSCVSTETDNQIQQPQTNKCGSLEIALLYDAPMRKMTVHVLQARNMPSRDRVQPTHTQVRLLMLPSKKQKHKTKIRSGDNPQYMESFLLHKVNPEDVNSMGLRLRVYGCEKMRRERLIGEAVVSFAHMNLELENNLWLTLEPRANTAVIGCSGDMMSLARSDSTSSTHSMQHGGVPELLLGLAFNAITGRLSVEIVKGSHFRNLSLNRAPDTYVKLALVSSTGQQLAHSKTSVQRGQPNPLFKETFIFQVALFQLADVTLVISVYNRRGVTKRKEMLGWFSLGLNSSGAEELAHWMDMKDTHQEQICRWHVLVNS